ncbi:MAG: hypothetical protein ACKKL5_03580 [Candidatus Komeilibacteria bacterium]
MPEYLDKDVQQQKEGQQPSNPYLYLGVLVGAMVIFGMTFWQVQHNIKAPFADDNSDNNDNQVIANADNLDIEKLKKQDTDGDGLSDYLEQYVYGTSSYIADTDSDDISDSDEVLQGTDPLCGQDGGCAQPINTPSAMTGDDSLDALINNDQVNNDTGASSADGMTRQQLTDILVQMGFNATDLANVSDQDLALLYDEALRMAQNSGDTINPVNDTGNITAEEIRQALLDSGVSASQLEGITDEELIQLYQQAISSQAQ